MRTVHFLKYLSHSWLAMKQDDANDEDNENENEMELLAPCMPHRGTAYKTIQGEMIRLNMGPALAVRDPNQSHSTRCTEKEDVCPPAAALQDSGAGEASLGCRGELRSTELPHTHPLRPPA